MAQFGGKDNGTGVLLH